MYEIVYDGKVVGQVSTNKSLSLDECLEILGIDVYEMLDDSDPRWDWELFEMRVA